MLPGEVDSVEIAAANTNAVKNLVRIPAGKFTLGESSLTGTPYTLTRPRSVELPAFMMSATEVSNREYREYVLATGVRSPSTWAAPYDTRDDELPVVDVSWDEANRYCRWRGVRLPTQDEWEAAARGVDGLVYPWGDAPRLDMMRAEPPDTREGYLRCAQSVDNEEPRWRSPFGMQHMCSNVQEYVDGVAEDRAFGIVIVGRSWRQAPDRPPSRISTLSGRRLRSFDRGFRIAATATAKE